jgi:hypothetical protein
MLILQLRRRFGRVSAAAAARIDKATDAELNGWAGRVLTASSLDEVLGTPVAVPAKKTARAARTQARGER